MMNVINNDRFKGLDWVMDDYPEVMIAGAGGISSWLSLFLGRIGVPMHIFDYDIVEQHNLGGQLFALNSIGQYKVNAVRNAVTQFCLYPNLSTHFDKINFDTLPRLLSGYENRINYIFSGVDNIQARKDMALYFLNSANSMSNKNILLDGRLLAETFQIYVVTKYNRDQYFEEAIFPDEEAVDSLPCTAKQTSHVGAMIATMMTNYFTNILFNKKYNENIRDVPFFTSYDVSSNTLITRDKVDITRLSNI